MYYGSNYSLVFVYNTDTNKVLLCKCKGENTDNFDFIGGKRRPEESGIECAYRRLNTETSMDERDITLQRVLDFYHVLDQRRLQVYAGAVSCDGDILNDSSRYMWADIDGDLCSCHEYITESCLNYILSSLNYNPEIGLFEGTKKS